MAVSSEIFVLIYETAQAQNLRKESITKVRK